MEGVGKGAAPYTWTRRHTKPCTGDGAKQQSVWNSVEGMQAMRIPKTRSTNPHLGDELAAQQAPGERAAALRHARPAAQQAESVLPRLAQHGQEVLLRAGRRAGQTGGLLIMCGLSWLAVQRTGQQHGAAEGRRMQQRRLGRTADRAPHLPPGPLQEAPLLRPPCAAPPACAGSAPPGGSGWT